MRKARLGLDHSKHEDMPQTIKQTAGLAFLFNIQ
jgi:hypothetical protein